MKRTLLLLFLFSSSCVLWAQMDSKATTGIINYQNANYDIALKNLELATSRPTELKSKNLPKAYYYLGKTYIAQWNAAAGSQDKNVITQVADHPKLAYEALKNAEKYDDGKWGNKIEFEFKNLHNTLLSVGLNFLNYSYSTANASTKLQYLNTSLTYLTYAAETNNQNYVAFDFLAQTQLNLADTLSAQSNFEKAISLFKSVPPQNPDQLCAYMYYRLALIHCYGNKDFDNAISTIEEGRAALEEEHKKLKQTSAWQSNQTQLAQQYDNAVADLTNFELDLYLNAPDKMEAALQKFEAAAANEPDNYIVHVAYAGLLEKVDIEKSIAMYKKAIAIDDHKKMAPFNLGALYNNLAKDKYVAAYNQEDMKRYDALSKEGDAFMEQAYEQFRLAYAVYPNDVELLRALKQGAVRLDKMDEYKEYTERLKNLGY